MNEHWNDKAVQRTGQAETVNTEKQDITRTENRKNKERIIAGNYKNMCSTIVQQTLSNTKRVLYNSTTNIIKYKTSVVQSHNEPYQIQNVFSTLVQHSLSDCITIVQQALSNTKTCAVQSYNTDLYRKHWKPVKTKKFPQRRGGGLVFFEHINCLI